MFTYVLSCFIMFYLLFLNGLMGSFVGMSCVSEGCCQDMPPGFYQVCTLKMYRGKSTGKSYNDLLTRAAFKEPFRFMAPAVHFYGAHMARSLRAYMSICLTCSYFSMTRLQWRHKKYPTRKACQNAKTIEKPKENT